MKFSFPQWTARAARLLWYAAAISMPVMAQEAPPSADSFVLNATPKANYGGWPQLAVTPGATTFIQFNLSSLPANANVSKATLRLYVDAVTASGSVEVYELTTPWTEGALNFTNAPTPGLSATGSKPLAISSANVNQFVLIDITTLVQEWVNGTVANNGIALKLTSSTGSVSFDSKESPLTSHEPELEITLAEAGPQGPAGVQGPQGPQGPAGPQGISGNLVPGSPLYVQNGTTTQAGASFNIDGSGTVGATLAGQTVNSVKGYQIGGVTELNADGKVNLLIGQSAGNGTITGGNSQLIGDSAGAALTSGNSDVFIGSNAGAATTTGNGDVYVGWKSGQAATTAPFNTFLGGQAGTSTTTGGGNLFAGFSAGLFNSTGQNNTFAGSNAGYNNTTGVNNLYLGFNSGLANTTGSNNIYLAHDGAPAEDNTIRIGAGQTAAFIAGIYGASVSTGQPVYVDSAGHLGTGGAGTSSVASFNGRSGAVLPSAGDYDLAQITGVVSPAQLAGTYTQPLTLNNAANAYSGASLSVSGKVGGNAFDSVTGYQIAGTTVLNQNSVNVTMIGAGAGNPNISGGYSQLLGNNAGASLTTGNADVFVGSGAGLQTTTGNGDVYLGYASGQSATVAAYNTFLGGQTGALTTTGGANLFAGFSSGLSNTTGDNDTFLGADTGYLNTTGSGNLFLGYNSGILNTTGSNNIYLLHNGVGAEDNTIRIGSGQTAAFVSGIYGVTSASGVPVYINSNGQLGTMTSSRIYKQDIQDMGDITSALMKLRPVTFYYKPEYDKGHSRQYGLIAEEVARIYPDLVAYNPDGSPYTVRYQYLSSMLLNEFQKQYRKAQAQAELIDAQQQHIDELEQRLSRIESMISGQQSASNQTAEVGSVP